MILCSFSNSNSGYAYGPRSRSQGENTDSKNVGLKAADTTVTENEDFDMDIGDPGADGSVQLAEDEGPDAGDPDSEDPEAENPEDEVSDDEESDNDDPEAEDPEAEDSDNDEPENRVAHNSFIALMHFFNAAGNQSLKGEKSSRLPNEVLPMIMQYSDMQTYRTLAKVPSCCREMACTRFRLNDDYAVVGIDQNPKRVILENVCSGKKKKVLLSNPADTPC